MTFNFNNSPYFDDFVANAEPNNYLKVLFVPGNPVQTREMNQIQSMLQNQIQKQGDATFVNGTVIQGGTLAYDNTIQYAKCQATYAGVSIDSIGQSLVGLYVVGQSSEVTVSILHYEPSTSTDPGTIYYKVVSATSTYQNLIQGELVFSSTLNLYFQLNTGSTAIGTGSIVSISQGIYYVNGYFVGVDSQSIVLDKYDSTPSVTIGLTITENIVTPSQDITLYDNATGTPNQAAPGANRYQIVLTLTTRNLYYTNSTNSTLTFIPLMQIVNGSIQYNNNTTQFSKIEKLLAQRTYDEAGDFTINPYKISCQPYRNNNLGQWAQNIPCLIGDIVTNSSNTYIAMNTGYTGTTAPVQTFGIASDGNINWQYISTMPVNNGANVLTTSNLATNIADNGNLTLNVGAGKSYVHGHAIKTPQTQITIPKAATAAQKTGIAFGAPNSDYTPITNVVGIVNTGTMTAINIVNNSSTVIGTAYATSLEYVSGTIGSTTSVYNLFIVDLQMYQGYTFVSNAYAITSASGFSANLNLTPTNLSGVVTTTSGSATVFGSGTAFTTQLVNGATIYINGTAVTVQNIINDYELTLTATAAASLTDAQVVWNKPTLTSGILLAPVTDSYIQSVRTSSGSIDFAYEVKKYLTFTATSTSYTYTLSTSGDTFVGITGHIVSTAAGAIINPTISLDSTQTIMTISGLTSGTTYGAQLIIRHSQASAKEKTKTLATLTVIVNSNTITDVNNNTLLSGYGYTSANIPLTQADAQVITKITMSGTPTTYSSTGETDITTWYSLSNNSNSSYYDISSAKRISGMPVPQNPIKITFEYFSHSSGDYFSANSYSSIPYGSIPVEVHNNTEYRLADCIDFRSRTDSPATFGANALIASPCLANSSLVSSYSYYLPRIDLLVLSSGGVFEYITGIPMTNPVVPVTPDMTMPVAELSFLPYTSNPSSDITITVSKHQRYTMADIGDLDKRLSNVEYYVAMSQLEQNTSNMNVYDANGLSRYKNGFIADSFNSLSVADTSNPDYRAIIGISDQVLTGNTQIFSVPLTEPQSITPSNRQSLGYSVYGDYYMLPYTENACVTQSIATTTQYVNPYSTFRWSGNMQLTPSSDVWVDTDNINNVINTSVSSTNTKAWVHLRSNFSMVYAQWTGNFWQQPRNYWTFLPEPLRGVTTTATTSSTTNTVQDSTSTINLPYSQNMPVVVQASGLEPFTQMYFFVDGTNYSSSVVPCTKIYINYEAGQFQGFNDTTASNTYDPLRNVITTDYQGNFSSLYPGGFWTHDNILSGGEVFKYWATSTLLYAGVIVAREVEYNPAASAYQTVLYVTNMNSYTATSAYGNTFSSQSATSVPVGVTITGSISGATANVTSVVAPANMQTNSLGNLYSVFYIPPGQVKAGTRTFSLSSSTSLGNGTSNTYAPFVVGGTLDVVNTTTYNTTNTQYNTVLNFDPLAQIFTIPSNMSNGCIITSADIYVAYVEANETQPLIVQICETENGYPAADLLNGATAVLNPQDITVSSDGSVATRCQFLQPIVLQHGKEYCLKLISNSSYYKVFVAQMGQTSLTDPTLIVAQQPYTGAFFESQNNSTWVPNPNQTLKFTLNQALFSSNASAITLQNQTLNTTYMPVNPFITANGTTLVRVYNPSHGCQTGFKVTYAGSTDPRFVGTFTVASVVSDDYYTINLSATSTTTGPYGGTAVTCDTNIRYDAINVYVGNAYYLNNGSINVSITGNTGSGGLDATQTKLALNTSVGLINSKYVMSPENETGILAGSKSLTATINLTTNDLNLSPLLNRNNISAILNSYKVYPTSTAQNLVTDNTTICSAQASVTFSSTNNTITFPTGFDMSNLQIGSYITITGTTNNNYTTEIINLIGLSIYVSSTVTSESPASTTITQATGFVSDIAPVGSTSESIYITNPIILANSSTGIQAMFSVISGVTGNVQIYYRVATSQSRLNNTPWTNIAYSMSANQSTYTDQQVYVNGLTGFTAGQIKLILTASNPCDVPSVKDFSAIFLA